MNRAREVGLGGFLIMYTGTPFDIDQTEKELDSGPI